MTIANVTHQIAHTNQQSPNDFEQPTTYEYHAKTFQYAMVNQRQVDLAYQQYKYTQ